MPVLSAKNKYEMKEKPKGSSFLETKEEL